MAKTSMKIKQQRKQKFSTREYNRCRICGRPHAYSVFALRILVSISAIGSFIVMVSCLLS